MDNADFFAKPYYDRYDEPRSRVIAFLVECGFRRTRTRHGLTYVKVLDTHNKMSVIFKQTAITVLCFDPAARITSFFRFGRMQETTNYWPRTGGCHYSRVTFDPDGTPRGLGLVSDVRHARIVKHALPLTAPVDPASVGPG